MQAAFTFRRSPILALVTAFAVATVLILAGAGGYWLKSLALQGAATVSVTRVAAQTSPPPVRSDRVRDLDMPAGSQASSIGSSQGLFGSANNGENGAPAQDQVSHRGGIQY